MSRSCPLPVILLAACLLPGCGGDNAADPTDVQLGSDEQLYAAGVRSEVNGLLDSFRQEGLGGLKTSLEGTMENLEFMESSIDAAGQYRETCEKIFQGIRELNMTVQGAPNREQVHGKLEELRVLSEELPTSGIQDTGTGTAQT